MVGGDDEAVERLEPVLEALAPGVDSASARPAARRRGARGAGLAALRAVRRRPLREDGPQRHRVRPDAGVRRGLQRPQAREHRPARAGDGRRDDAAARPRPLQVRARHRRDQRALAARLGHLLVAPRPDGARRCTRRPSSTSTPATSSDSGEGRWTVQAAVEEGVPVPVLAASLFNRFASRGEADFGDRVLPRCGRRSAATSRRARSSDRDGRTAGAAGEPARGRPRAAADARPVRARHLRRVGRPDAQEDHAGALRARRPPAAAAALRDRRRRAHRRRRRRVPRRTCRTAVKQHARDPFRQDVWDELAAQLHWLTTDFADAGGEDKLHDLRRQARRRAGARRQPRLLPRRPAARLPDDRRGARQAAATTAAGRALVVEKPFGHDLASAKRADREAPRVLQRGRDLPDRPLPRQGDRPEHAGAPLRQRDLRADLEPPVRRPRPDHGRRVDRDRGARRLLRERRRDPRHLPEPPPAAARAHRDGAADRLHSD